MANDITLHSYCLRQSLPHSTRLYLTVCFKPPPPRQPPDLEPNKICWNMKCMHNCSSKKTDMSLWGQTNHWSNRTQECPILLHSAQYQTAQTLFGCSKRSGDVAQSYIGSFLSFTSAPLSCYRFNRIVGRSMIASQDIMMECTHDSAWRVIIHVS